MHVLHCQFSVNWAIAELSLVRCPIAECSRRETGNTERQIADYYKVESSGIALNDRGRRQCFKSPSYYVYVNVRKVPPCLCRRKVWSSDAYGNDHQIIIAFSLEASIGCSRRISSISSTGVSRRSRNIRTRLKSATRTALPYYRTVVWKRLFPVKWRFFSILHCFGERGGFWHGWK